MTSAVREGQGGAGLVGGDHRECCTGCGMEFGAPNCGVAHVRRGRVVERGGVATRLSRIKELDETESYR